MRKGILFIIRRLKKLEDVDEKYRTAELILEKIKMPKSLEHFRDTTYDDILHIVSRDLSELQHIAVSEKLFNALNPYIYESSEYYEKIYNILKYNAGAIKYINNPTESMCVAAVTNYAYSIKYIKQTKKKYNGRQ